MCREEKSGRDTNNPCTELQFSTATASKAAITVKLMAVFFMVYTRHVIAETPLILARRTNIFIMHIDPNTGLLDHATQMPSPNCDARPMGSNIDLLVIHAISLPAGEFGGPWIDALFCNRLDPSAHDDFAEICRLTVSAHALIRRDGEIIQYVPFQQRAWHAGESNFQGRERCNDFSIGIELEGCDDKAFEATQYQQLAQLSRALMHSYPGITPERITGHSDIAPGRKTDPGPHFDWDHLWQLLTEKQH
jgi:N-acetyl-anhydromuramoyl-L-alanine amidase